MPVQMLNQRYEVGERLGAGGMAEVFIGRDNVLGRTVAIKTLLQQHAGDPHFIERFRREAQHAAALNHPNVVSVYDTGSWDGTHYIVMEYVEGKTLRDVIREEGPLLPERVLEIAADVCAGLAFAHGHHLVHRDVKPANIMITSGGGVKVADFGIARAAPGETVTQTAMVLGTAQYFSPEQAQSAPVDARSDIYSLGVVMYEMLTRQVPFTGSSPVAIAYKHVKEDPALPSSLNPDVPADIEAIVMKAMAKNPDNRYQSALEMREDLMRAQHGRPVEATPVLTDATGIIGMSADETVMIERTGRAKPPPTEEERRRKTGFILLGIVIAAILGVAIWALIGILGGTRIVTVPGVLGERTLAAQQRLEAVGLNVLVGNGVFSTKYEAGTIAEQDPPGGERIERGQTVTLEPSLGQQLIEVPDVEGMSESAAIDAIEDAGLDVGDISRVSSESVAAGRVISQSPPEGTAIPKNRKIDLTVSSGPPTTRVPNVVERTREDAEDTLRNFGFEVQVIEEEVGPDCEVEPGRVCRQDPEGGEQVEEGSTVTIWVAQEAEAPECSNGIDDDGDGATDHPFDDGCTDPDDDSETSEGEGGD